MTDMWFKNNLIYTLLLVSVISAILALITSDFIFKSGTAGIGIFILLVLNFRKVKPSKDTWFIIGAFLFSIGGDWFLSNMDGDPVMFSKGIALFFLAHVGYLMFALLNGRINWKITGIILTAFLVFYFLILYPAIEEKILVTAVLIYLLISCLSMGAAISIQNDRVVKWAYAFGIFLILFSDTIISLTEFTGYNTLNFIILPTYYLAHISITFSLIRKTDLK